MGDGARTVDRPALVRDEIALLAAYAEAELRAALTHFAPFNSPHEGKAVIEEELDELWEHVKANSGQTEAARIEAIQIAAMALRYAHDLCSDKRGGQSPAEGGTA